MADSEERLILAFYDRFQAGLGFSTIVQARQFAVTILGEPIQPRTYRVKATDETIEQALVKVSRLLIQVRLLD